MSILQKSNTDFLNMFNDPTLLRQLEPDGNILTKKKSYYPQKFKNLMTKKNNKHVH